MFFFFCFETMLCGASKPIEWSNWSNCVERNSKLSTAEITSSTFDPIVGLVWTTSFIRNWYRMVVLPALSKPTMTSLCSAGFQKRTIKRIVCYYGKVL